MINRVDDYLAQLKTALQGCDAATTQDALADAEDHLRTALENARREQAGTAEEELLTGIIEEYGAPEEVAAAYREVERRQPTALASASPRPNQNPAAWAAFFRVMTDPQAWGAILYMIISLLTGILYFTWAITGLSIALGLIVLIIGLPFLALFMLSVRGLALLEGRIVEALLGVRMPRRPIFIDQTRGWWARFKDLFNSWQTWKATLYMLLMLPIGVFYFTLVITLIVVGIALAVAPIAQLAFNIPILTFDNVRNYLPQWSLPLMEVGGVLLVVCTFHLARLIGRLQGAFAKFMLVSE